MCSDVSQPFKALKDLADKSIKHSVGLPAQEEAVELWSGIGFSLAGLNYVAEMGSISELLHVPRYTVVPGVSSWVLGVANVRGRLIPIIDLANFFGIKSGRVRTRQKRVLIVEQDDLLNGLLVDTVQGMQYLNKDDFKTETTAKIPPSIADFVVGAYGKQDTDWLVFDAKRLINSERFLDVSLS